MRHALESIVQDVRFAVRSLRRVPLFALTSIAIIALGAGAAGGMFGIVHHLLLSPYVVPDPDRVVMVGDRRTRQGEVQGGVSPARYAAYAGARGFERLEAYRADQATLRTNEGSTRLEAARVTPGLFSTLGVGLAAGRDFTAADGQPGAPATALVSERLVKTRFDGDASRALGASLVLDGVSTRLIGVLRPASELPAGSDVWRPWSPAGAEREERGDRSLTLVGRLRPAVSVAELRAELQAIGREQSREFPATDAGLVPRLSTLREGVLDEYSPVFEKLMLVALLFTLLVVAANLAGLQLARGAARQREWAVRAALGATSARLVQQSLIESLVLAAVGGVAGVAAASFTVRAVMAAMPASIAKYVPGWSAVGMDAGVVGYTLALSALTGVAFGLLPAVHAARRSDANGLRGGSGALGSVRARARAVLVVAEVALSLTLLAGGALMVEGLHRLVGPDLGFEPSGVLATHIVMPEVRYPDPITRAQFHARVLERIASVPGVTDVALISRLPASSGMATVPVRVEARDLGLGEEDHDALAASISTVTPGAFRLLRSPLVTGRDFAWADDATSERVAIVNEAFVRRTWHDRNALGRHVMVPDADGTERVHTVVGVARDLKRNWVERGFAPIVYLADAQRGAVGTHLLVRGHGDPLRLAPAVRTALAALDADVPVGPPLDFAADLAEHISGVRIVAAGMSLLGVFALLLAAIGLYGLIAFQVARRTAEFGVRMALGAQRGDILRLVFGEGARLVGVGFAVGVPLAAAACWAMTALLFGVVAPSAATLGGIVLMLCVVTAGALGWPAWRASQLDPADSLRRD